MLESIVGRDFLPRGSGKQVSLIILDVIFSICVISCARGLHVFLAIVASVKQCWGGA